MNPFALEEIKTNGHIYHLEPFDCALYFSAPNLSVGPVQLMDVSSNPVPLLRTNQNSEAAYPDQYSLSLVRHNLNIGRLQPLEPVAITGTGVGYGFARFSLPGMFKIEKPGNYRLTIWPKIYKRSETNHDIVKRIDLPSVTIPINWTGNAAKQQ